MVGILVLPTIRLWTNITFLTSVIQLQHTHNFDDTDVPCSGTYLGTTNDSLCMISLNPWEITHIGKQKLKQTAKIINDEWHWYHRIEWEKEKSEQSIY